MSVGVIFVHGMGETKPEYSHELQSLLRSFLPSSVYGTLKFQEVFYQGILQANEQRYYREVEDKLDWNDLRKFMLFGFCDAASIESQKEGRGSPYYLVQKEIQTSFKALSRWLAPGTPVIVVAQSLGCQVMSNYLWDASKTDSNGLPVRTRHGIWSEANDFEPETEAFCRGKSVVRLMTTGCNIPIFVAGRQEKEITPIKPPNNAFKWFNYYDRDDALGWPLEELSDAYADLVTDIEVSVGHISGSTPLSHVRYWSDREFVRKLAAEIKACAGIEAV